MSRENAGKTFAMERIDFRCRSAHSMLQCGQFWVVCFYWDPCTISIDNFRQTIVKLLFGLDLSADCDSM